VLGELFEKGFPARGRGAEGDPRGAALPLLAPVLQRLTIEIKQTLRYASGPGAKALGRLVLLGPGAAVPGLAEALRDSLQLTVESENPVGADEARRPFGAASTGAAALRLRDAALLLVPTSARVLRRQQALTRTLRVSVLAAAVVLAGEFAWVRRAQAQVQSRIAEHAGEVDAIRARREAVQQAAAMSADLNNAAFATGDAIGSRAEWFAVLAELSGAVGSDIELVELRMFYEAQRPLVSLGGFALENRQATEGQPSADALGAFVQRVQESPLVKRVAIGATSSAQRGGRPARRFAVQVELVALPPQHALPDLPAGRKMEPITRDKPSVDVPAPTKSRPG
jgi:HAMP domain-containing protein